MYTYQGELDKETFKVLFTMALMEKEQKPFPDIPKEGRFLSNIIRKRVEVLKLPISFTEYAYMYIDLFVDRPGSAVLLLMDALEKYENQTVDIKKLAELYPDGFYDEETLIKIIDEEIKTGKRKWAEIY